MADHKQALFLKFEFYGLLLLIYLCLFDCIHGSVLVDCGYLCRFISFSLTKEIEPE